MHVSKKIKQDRETAPCVAVVHGYQGRKSIKQLHLPYLVEYYYQEDTVLEPTKHASILKQLKYGGRMERSVNSLSDSISKQSTVSDRDQQRLR